MGLRHIYNDHAGWRVRIDYNRDRKAYALLQRGVASLAEIMEASFGEWPPKGLDIAPDHLSRHRVTLHETSDPDALGWVPGNRSDKMYLSSRFHETNEAPASFAVSYLYTIMGHEGTHILQHLHRQHGWVAPCATLMQGLLQYDRKHHDAAAHERALRRIQRARTAVAGYFGFDSNTLEDAQEKLNYYQQGNEMQARLHETMVAGYGTWGRLPATYDELAQALVSFGFKPTEDVKKRLAEPGVRERVETFRIHRRRSKASDEMKVVYDALSANGRQLFWASTLPALYADLIEMYGDRQGWKRFAADQQQAKKAPAQRRASREARRV